MFLELQALPLWQNVATFMVASAVIWLVGTRLSAYADVIAERTGLGQAFVGLVLLAVATSLPELAATTSATVTGKPALAISNLLGGVVMQTAILVIADVVMGQRALTYFAPRPVLLLEGVLLIVLLAIVLIGTVLADLFAVFGVSAWSVVLLVSYLLLLHLLRQYEGHGRWQPVQSPQGREDDATDERADDGPARRRPSDDYQDWSMTRLLLSFAVGSTIILVVGVTLTQVADAVAVQTGLGASFVGAVFLAIATSLPELSTTIAAIRLGAVAMAVSNIFGSNAVDVTLIFLADVLHRDGPVLAAVDRSAIFLTTLGIVVTAIYVIGLIERRDRVIFRMGYDSAAVLALYVGGLVVQYMLR